MPKIYTINQLDTVCTNKIEEVVDYVVDIVYEKLRENIVDKAYNKDENTDYFNGMSRTDEFLESFQRDETKKELRQVIGRIFQDINIMNARSARIGCIWNAHENIWGEDVRDELGWILNSSNTGMWNGSREGHFWDDTLDWIDANLDNIILEGANKAGITIKKK